MPTVFTPLGEFTAQSSSSSGDAIKVKKPRKPRDPNAPPRQRKPKSPPKESIPTPSKKIARERKVESKRAKNGKQETAGTDNRTHSTSSTNNTVSNDPPIPDTAKGIRAKGKRNPLDRIPSNNAPPVTELDNILDPSIEEGVKALWNEIADVVQGSGYKGMHSFVLFA